MKLKFRYYRRFCQLQKNRLFPVKAPQDVYGRQQAMLQSELKEFTKRLRDDIANLRRVSDVQVLGSSYGVAIEVSEATLQQYNHI